MALTLTTCVGLIGCNRQDPPTGGSSVDALVHHAAPMTPAAEPEPPPPPPPDFELERRFSPPFYAAVASRVIPYDKLVTNALGAARQTELQAVELDFFENDWLYRRGGLVLLGTERGRVVALTTRYYADIRYPDPRLISDGWGSAEIGRQYLAVKAPGGDCFRGEQCTTPAFRLRPFGSKHRERDPFASEPEVEYKVFDEHDVALLYFPLRGSPFRESDTLGIPNPTRAIKLKLQEASNLYGFEMAIISKESLAELRSGIRVESTAGSLLKFGVSLVATPFIGSVAGPIAGLTDELNRKITDKVTDVVSELGAEAIAGTAIPLVDDWERQGRGQDDDPSPEHVLPTAPSSIPSVVADARLEVVGNEVEVIGRDDHKPSVRLLGVKIEDQGRKDLSTYMMRALSSGQVIVSSERWGNTRAGALVLLPSDSVVLNIEALRHGFARLDLEHAELLRSFPSLVDAAWEALENRTGLARDWAEDDEYVTALRSLHTDSDLRSHPRPRRRSRSR